MDYLKILGEVLQEARLRVVDAIEKPDAFKTVGKSIAGGKTLLIDKLAEEAVVDALSERIGGFTLISEESGALEVNGGGLLAILDPLDGSTNASRGFPFYSISLALSTSGYLKDTVAGGVIDVPRNCMYLAAKDEGAFLNGCRIKVSDARRRLNSSVLALDINVKGKAFNYLTKISPVVEKAYSVRFMGSNALQLCMVASGVFDAFVDFRGILRILDVAAGVLIVKEAGGVVLDRSGRELDSILTPGSRVSLIAASNIELASDIVKLSAF